MKNIFVVDPSIMIHKIVELTFKDSPEYNVRFFSSYPLNIDEGEKAEYIFITIDLPGIEIEETIKELKSKYNCPLIAMVPKFLDYNRDSIVNAGADAILEKPFTSDELRNTLVSLSESTSLKEETIAEIDSETFEEIGSFDEDLTLSEEDLMDVDREILEQEVSGDELIMDDFQDEIDTKELQGDGNKQDAEFGELDFDEQELESELDAELGEDIDKELDEELEEVEFTEEELEKDLESMDLSSIEEEAEEFEEEMIEQAEIETGEIHEAETQRIEPEQLAQFREIAEDYKGEETEEEMEEVKGEEFEDFVEEVAEENVDEKLVKEIDNEEQINIDEEIEQPSVSEETDLTSEEKTLDLDSAMASSSEQAQVKDIEMEPTKVDEFDNFVEEVSEKTVDEKLAKEIKNEEEINIEEEIEQSSASEASDLINNEDFSHPTQFDESDMIEAEKKELHHDSEPIMKEVMEKTEPVVESVVAEETTAKGLSLTEDDIKRIAEEVVNRLSDRIIREIAWEVIPQIAEDIVLRRIKELEKEIE
ncbi:response regulator [Thermotomaculum hydrothermale]|nr:hypothetical protein [Thermotomaculum hydrothermale]